MASAERSKLAAEMSPAEDGFDQHIAAAHASELLFDRLQAEKVEELRRHRERRGQVLAFHRRRGDVDGDHYVGAEFARLVDRQVVGDAAVDQQATVDFHRCDHRYCHAGAHRLRHAAAAEHHRFAGFDVGRHRFERDGQLPEVIDAYRRLGKYAEERLDRSRR